MAKKSKKPNDTGQRYRAPALEKGLDILELLARSSAPLTTSMIVQSLDRSMSELFRMIQVLEYRGFIEQAPNDEGYRPSDKLFSLGMEQAPNKSMLEIALPVMRELSNKIGQSCHLAVRSRGDIVVVARMESGEQIGFTVRIGWRRSLALTRSGAVLLAYQQDNVKKRWIASLSSGITKAQIADLLARAALVKSRGYDRAKSEFVTGVTDLSAPILRGATAAAALTVPFVHATQLMIPIDETLQHLRIAAAEISASLLRTDHRV